MFNDKVCYISTCFFRSVNAMVFSLDTSLLRYFFDNVGLAPWCFIFASSVDALMFGRHTQD